MMSLPAMVVATALMLPLTIWIAVVDMRTLKIPNWSVLAIFGVFLATGSWGLPFDVFLWRIGYAVAALFVGFLLYQLVKGKVGAGDLKLIAALAPFLSGANLIDFCIIYVAVSIIGLMSFMMLRRWVDAETTHWRALAQRHYYPAGVLLGPSMSIELLGETLWRLL